MVRLLVGGVEELSGVWSGRSGRRGRRIAIRIVR